MTFVINRLSKEKLLRPEARLLDLGCGEGNDAIAAAKFGASVIAVDADEGSIEKLKNETGDLLINPIVAKIESFNIKANEFDVIIAHNSLPFLSKDSCIETIKRCFEGLKSGGVFYFTIFGDRDEWSTRSNMNFWKQEEIVEYIKSVGFTIRYMAVEEGTGQTRSGKEKHWHLYRFTAIKP